MGQSYQKLRQALGVNEQKTGALLAMVDDDDDDGDDDDDDP